MAELRVTQVRSSIGTKPKHRGTLRALGLGRIGRSNDLPDRPEIRGMIAKVPHLVSVSEIESRRAPRRAGATRAKPPAGRTAARRGAGDAEAGTTGGDASTEAKERP
jgi:large subunit ribosomal protein L30